MMPSMNRYRMQGASWPGLDVRRAPTAAGLIAPSTAAKANDHLLGMAGGTPNLSTLEISTHFGTGLPAMLAKGAPRLKEPST